MFRELTDKEIQTAKALLKLFQIDGVPADQKATLGQISLFASICFQRHHRIEIISSTQYGKSLFVSLACLIRSCVLGRKVAVVAPKNEQAKIIMRYYIEHLGDNPVFYTQLEKDTKLERLRMEESKERIGLRNGGEMFALSAQARTASGIQAVMGQGADDVILDEAGLLPDDIEATVYRMIAGRPNGMYVKIGNPFYRNHFYQTWAKGDYLQIFIDYKQGLREGRYTEKFIEEAKTRPHFDVLFGCEFPPEESADNLGFYPLFTETEVANAQENLVKPFGVPRLGCDVAEGGHDHSAFVLRYPDIAYLVDHFQEPELMATTGRVKLQADFYSVIDQNVFIDSIGVGAGVLSRLHEQQFLADGVRFSNQANELDTYANTRAECYWDLKKWLSQGGKLAPSPHWKQLLWIRYKVDSGGRIQIMPKETMRKQGIPSPDVADALAITFGRKHTVSKSTVDRRKEKELLKNFDYYQSRAALRRLR